MQVVIKDVARLLSDLKHKARAFYVDRIELEIVMELSRYSENEIKEMMDLTKIA